MRKKKTKGEEGRIEVPVTHLEQNITSLRIGLGFPHQKERCAQSNNESIVLAITVNDT
jgi:hypothetical protein